MVTHRGITLIVIMVSIRHGMPRITATLIIRPGGPIVVTTHIIMAVTTNIIRATGEADTTVTRKMIIKTAVTVVMNMRTGMINLMTAAKRETRLTAITHHGLVAMYPLRHPGIQATGEW